MNTWLKSSIALLLLVLPFVPAVADDPDDKETARLVKQLGSSDFRTRDVATKRLTEIGEPALDALGKATDTLEMRRRAEALITVIEDKIDGGEHCLTGHTNSVWTVSVSADGNRLLTSSSDETLRLWDTKTGKELRVFQGHTGIVFAAALSPDGKRVLSGGDTTVRLWDATSGEEVHQMIGQKGPIISVAFGPEGKAVSASYHSRDGSIHVWDLNTGKAARVITDKSFGYDFGRWEKVLYSDTVRLAASLSYYDSSIRLGAIWSSGSVRNRSSMVARKR